MKRLTSAAFLSLFMAVTGCAFDAPDTELPPFALADDVTGSVGPDSERPQLLPFALADDVVGMERSPLHSPCESPNPHPCTPGVFVGCSDRDTNAVFCGDDGRSLEKEACASGCGAAACIDRDRQLSGPERATPN